MNIIQFCGCCPLACACRSVYRGIAFDACRFYLTCPDRSQICQYDKCFKFKECTAVCRPYGPICFDPACGCFWALGAGEADRIYKLDRRLRETDCLVVQLPDFCGSITGLDCRDADRLLICGSFGKAEVSKSDGCAVSWIEKASEEMPCCAVASVPCGLVSAFDNKHIHGMIWQSGSCAETTQCWLPDGCKIEDLAWCGSECDGCLCLYVLLTRHRSYSYLMTCRFCPVCGEPSRENPQRGRRPEEPACNAHPDRGGPGGSTEELIRSIALVEAALSHILNAEGEKIQAVLCRCDDPCQIRQVNADVYKMVMGVIQLEQVLYAKLQTAVEMWNINGDPCGCSRTPRARCNEEFKGRAAAYPT